MNGTRNAVVGFVGAVLVLSGCGGAVTGRMEPRYVAVHNALAAMGMAQTGPISEGSLAEGSDARITVHLDAGTCTTVVGLGSGDVRDLALRVLDETGTEVAAEQTQDAQAALQACPQVTGDYQIVVRMAQGSGGYTLATWTGGLTARGGVIAGVVPGGRGGRGSCGDPLPLQFGAPISGDTTDHPQGMLEGTCLNGSGSAPEHVYVFEVSTRSQVTAQLQSAYDGALYLQSQCGEAQTELACNDDEGGDTSRSAVTATVDPGRYFLIVDGYAENAGSYQLVVQASEAQPPEALCGDATPLSAGTPVSASTAGQGDTFSATCAGGAHSGDRVYRIDVPVRSRLRVRQQSNHDGALYLRSECANPSTELACNDDYQDRQHSLITAVVDPGRYFVFSDGYGTAAGDAYTLTADVAPETGGQAVADACAGPGVVTAGTAFPADTFSASDDTQGSCGGAGAPDVVHRVTVTGRARIKVTVADPEFQGAVYLQRTCGDATTEVACAQFPTLPMGPGPMPPGPIQGPMPTPPAPGTSAPALETTVQPGTYFVIVDGQRPDQFGNANVTVQVEDIAALELACRRAPQLRSGRAVQGNTGPGTDRFHATCAGGTASNDDLYQLRLTRRSRVTLNMSSDFDGALYVRRDCADPATELACNDDSTDNRHAFIETTLDAGTYFVYVDGFASGASGSYTLDTTISNP